MLMNMFWEIYVQEVQNLQNNQLLHLLFGLVYIKGQDYLSLLVLRFKIFGELLVYPCSCVRRRRRPQFQT